MKRSVITHLYNRMQTIRLKKILLGAALILLIPLLAMQFGSQVKWSLTDFVLMGLLLIGLGVVLDFIWRKLKNRSFRLLSIAITLGLFLLIWAELAVGMLGTPLVGK